MEEENEQIKEVLNVQNRRQKQQTKYFNEWTEKKDFIYPTNVEDKIFAALESPVTMNQPVDSQGVPNDIDSKIYTTEHNYRLTPTELEYFYIRKMKEEQRIKGNLDLEEHLSKTDDSFEPADNPSESPETQKSSDSESLDDLLKL